MDGFLVCCLVKRLRIVSQREKMIHEYEMRPLSSFINVAALPGPLGI